jgi:hypothetical protein
LSANYAPNVFSSHFPNYQIPIVNIAMAKANIIGTVKIAGIIFAVWRGDITIAMERRSIAIVLFSMT